MDVDDESSAHPYWNPGLQTPGTNKRMRSDNGDAMENETNISSSQKFSNNNWNTHVHLAATQRNEYPPITLEFKKTNNKTDRKLIEELINKWKINNGIEIDIIGRFGFKKVLLIFPRNAATLDELLDKNHWPNTIDDIEYKLSFLKYYLNVIL